MALQEQNKTQNTEPKRDIKMDGAKQSSDGMDSAKNAIREGLKKASGIIDHARVDTQSGGMKALGEWVKRTSESFENLGEDRNEKRSDSRNEYKTEGRTEGRADTQSDSRSGNETETRAPKH